jgi:hypothetical protein
MLGLPSFSLRLATIFAVPLLAALAACTTMTEGNDGHATFSYGSGSATKPLIVGVTQTLVVSGLPANGASIASSAPDVVALGAPTLSYQCDSQTGTSSTTVSSTPTDPCPEGSTKQAIMTLSVTARAAGTATLDVYSSGALYDSLDVTAVAGVESEADGGAPLPQP